jgi:KaiC/GvpD/RAD55 family RecA-like ATPase
MSDNNVLNKLMAEYENSESSQMRKKEDIIYKKKIDSQYNEIIRNEKLRKSIKNIDLSRDNTKRLQKIKEDNTNYFEKLKEAAVFINDDFKKDVPFFPGTITMCIANTGDGKSTVSANVAFQSLVQGKRVLMIANEERTNDCYNRITCLIKKWHYQEHDKFTDDQKKIFNNYIDILGNKLTIVDNMDEDGKETTSQTTSVEGIEQLFHIILREKENGNKFDVIIIDYYQNISESLDNPGAATWQNQERFSNMIDQFKNVVDCPIVLMAQKKASKDDTNDGTYKDLVEGRKSISNKATSIIEVKADKENFRTEFIIKKSRWSSANGKTIYTGYDMGKYVKYTDDFQRRVRQKKLEMEENKLLQRTMRSIQNGES